MGKVKVIKKNLDSNLNGTNFTNIPSGTVFSFGKFNLTSNFDGKKNIDFSNTLTSFVNGVTLETLNIDDTESDILYYNANNAVLNLKRSDLNTFVRFGSAYEFLRVSIENIITNYPASLFINSQISRNINITYYDYSYNSISDRCTFKIPTDAIVNSFGLVYNDGNISEPDNITLKNLNLSYDKYLIWLPEYPTELDFEIVGFTGNSTNVSAVNYTYLLIEAKGNPFNFISGTTSPTNFHLKPKNKYFEQFRAELNQYEKYIISNRIDITGFELYLDDPTLLENGEISYSKTKLVWATSDGYNIDYNTPSYSKFLNIMLSIGDKYDQIKTDLIARFLTPASLKTYDLTEEGKITKLLRLYGREFDQLKQFIDSLTYINKITYDKIDNAPDQIINNIAKTMGWNYFSLLNEEELVESFLSIDEQERNLNDNLMPAEIDIELWRRILNNTNYFWKSKGTRDAIKSMFLMIGIPEEFINITEHIYTVDGKINPNSVGLTVNDFSSRSFPYDDDGYPKAPTESSDFYFQISGNTDSGQKYMNEFRNAGFDLTRIPDNRKSWVQTGETYRSDDTTLEYFQKDSKLVLNTKEVDVSLDAARALENDIFQYFSSNNSGVDVSIDFVNISLNVSGSQTVFTLPDSPTNVKGDFEVRFNGILLNPPKSGSTTGVTSNADYTIDYSTNTFTLASGITAEQTASYTDVVQVTYIYSGSTYPISGISVNYVVTRLQATASGTIINLPSYTRNAVQLTIDGIALTPQTSTFTGDYTLTSTTPSGYTQILITNSEVISYLQTYPNVEVAYTQIIGTDTLYATSEIIRVNSYSGSKFYYSSSFDKNVLLLNREFDSENDLKILIDGIGLKPTSDYTINPFNPYEIILPKAINYGSVISAYYIFNEEMSFILDLAHYGITVDIDTLSYLQFVELLQRRLINAKNRKTITDFKGGWYPTLYYIYERYYLNSLLSEDNPLKSNGLTFNTLYTFLNKYNTFFQKFIDQLLASTIILGESGLVVRNTLFTKQKFAHKIGTNLYASGSTETDMRGGNIIEYMGDDGAVFLIDQDISYVETSEGILGSLTLGGENITSNYNITEYGVYYRLWGGSAWGSWINNSLAGSGLTTNDYTITLSGISNGETYEYFAYINTSGNGYSGETLQTIIPYLETTSGTTTENTIITGGENIYRYEDVTKYYMKYKESEGLWNNQPVSGITTALVSNSFSHTITGLTSNTEYDYAAIVEIEDVEFSGATLQITTPAIP